MVTRASALLLILAATPSRAEPADRVSVHHDAPPGAAWYARLRIENRIGVYNRTTTHATAQGPVSVQYWTTLPSVIGDPASADRACVVSTPPGVIASPDCVEILETDAGEIRLLKYIGG